MPLDPPLDPSLDPSLVPLLEVLPPSLNCTSGTDEHAEASIVSQTVRAAAIAVARRVPVTLPRLAQNVPVRPNIAPPRT